MPEPLSLDEARSLIVAAVAALDVHPEDVAVTAEHFLDAEVRDRGGLERLFVLERTVERFGLPEPAPMRIVRETATSGLLGGGWHLGYAVADRATGIAIEKAAASGIALVAAGEHRYSGVLGLYVERVARAGLVGIALSSGTLLTAAPYGGREPRLSTNPIAVGVPGGSDPVVWDTATASLPGTTLTRAAETGEPLPSGAAVDAAGAPTVDARAALEGALLTWGGHRGSGLSVVIQLLALLGGLDVRADGPADWEAAFVVLALDPGLLGPVDEFRARVAEFGAGIRATAPAAGAPPVRMPSDRSMGERRRRLAEGLPVSAADLAALRALAARRPAG